MKSYLLVTCISLNRTQCLANEKTELPDIPHSYTRSVGVVFVQQVSQSIGGLSRRLSIRLVHTIKVWGTRETREMQTLNSDAYPTSPGYDMFHVRDRNPTAVVWMGQPLALRTCRWLSLCQRSDLHSHDQSNLFQGSDSSV